MVIWGGRADPTGFPTRYCNRETMRSYALCRSREKSKEPFNIDRTKQTSMPMNLPEVRFETYHVRGIKLLL